MSAISSADNVRSHGDISTLTAAAATALRGVATLKARALKEVWNVAAAIPIEKGLSNTGTVPSANSRLSPLPHEPADYDRGATVDIPLDSAQDFKKKEKELQAKEQVKGCRDGFVAVGASYEGR
ncbi:hypothetical protein CASFOL_014997 [Castilleja foliolosa]|uniref:VAN3-binding protein-like auxin canalisation domain-containing protein n=1 Tax=Castilleja foliolosa TaxID=1961234 RepID=A0ABD3DG12_9LAMI